jgi:mRNA-degrading endonuclease HigB of HigAB toxin-antitoxin module
MLTGKVLLMLKPSTVMLALWQGNHYRVVVVITYQHGIVYIRFVGTHEEYDHVDAAII